MSVEWSWCSNLNRWDLFLYRKLCILRDTRRKAEHSVTLLQRFHPLCASLLFVLNRLTVFLSFCYIECELFAVFMKILFDNWRRFCRPSVIYVPVKCPRGGGIWSPEWTLVWGIWTTFWPWLGGGGGNLNNNFQKSQMPWRLPGGCWSFDLTNTL